MECLMPTTGSRDQSDFDLTASIPKRQDKRIARNQGGCETYVSPKQKRIKELENELAEESTEKAQMKRALAANKIEWWMY